MTMTPTSWRNSALSIAPFAAVLLGALLLRLWGISHESLWNDEWAVFHHIGIGSFAEFMRKARIDDPPAGPLFLGWMYCWGRILGPSVLAFRGLSVVLGLLTLGATMAMAREMGGKKLALLAGALLAMEPTHLYQSQEIRTYMPVMLLVCISNWAFLRWNGGGGKKWLFLNLAANTALPLWHWFGALMVVVQALSFPIFAARPKRILLWMLAHGPAVACTLLWMSTVNHARLDGVAAWIDTPAMDRITTDFLGGMRLQFITPVLMILLLFVLFKRTGIWRQYRQPLVFLVLWAFLPVLLLLLLSLSYRPCFVVRYVAFRMPGLAILLCFPLAMLAESFRPRIFIVAAVSLILSQALILGLEFCYSAPRRVNNEATADQLLNARKSTSAEMIVYCGQVNLRVLEWMLQQRNIGGAVALRPTRGLDEKQAKIVCKDVARGAIVYFCVRERPAKKQNTPPLAYFLLTHFSAPKFDPDSAYAAFLTSQLEKHGIRTRVRELLVSGQQSLYEIRRADSGP